VGEATGRSPDDRALDGADLAAEDVSELAWAFQDSVVDVLTTKTLRAAAEVGASCVVLGGGVAANGVLRDRLAAGAERLGIPLVVPRPGLCTDNAAMIGAAAWHRARVGVLADASLDARPSLKLAV
jgi:N6-L-threonylcarbamoyladenine synthase